MTISTQPQPLQERSENQAHKDKVDPSLVEIEPGAPRKVGGSINTNRNIRDDRSGGQAAHAQLEGAKNNARTKRRFSGLGSLLTIMLFCSLIGGALYLISGQPVPAPERLRAGIIELVAEESASNDRLEFDRFEFALSDAYIPQLRMSNVRLVAPNGQSVIEAAELRLALSLDGLRRGEFNPASITITGVSARLLREIDGHIVLSSGAALASNLREATSLAALMEDVELILGHPRFGDLETVSLQALTLRLEDLRSERAWTLDGGRATLDIDGINWRASSDLALLTDAGDVSTLAANYEGERGSLAAEFGVNLENLGAQDLAAVSPVFEWLGVLRAPISGAMRGEIDAAGNLMPVYATLRIASGVVQPAQEARPIAFDQAHAYFSFDPRDGALNFDELRVRSDWLSADLQGYAALEVDERGQLETMIGQILGSEVSGNPAGLYDAAVEIAQAQMDFQLRLDPFEFVIGEALIIDYQERVGHARGKLEVVPDAGWRFALDAELDRTDTAHTLSLWPERFAPATRRWLRQNLRAAEITDLELSLRGEADAPLKSHLGFAYAATDIQFSPSLPPITGASGRASLERERFVFSIDRGVIEPDQGGAIALSGSSFIIPDVTASEDIPAIVRLSTRSSLTAALSFLDTAPLNVMRRAGLDVDLAEGQVSMEGQLALPLIKGITLDDVTFYAQARARNLRSQKLIEGRDLRAPALEIDANERGIEVAGAGTLDGVPFDARWRQSIGAGSPPGRISGEVELTKAGLDRFNIALPDDMVSGRGAARFDIALARGAPPRLSMRSNLRGIGLAIPSLGWRKPRNSTGELSVEATLGARPVVNQISLDAASLSARGDIRLREGGGLERARFDRFSLGGWINTPVDLVGRGQGAAPEIILRGGEIDLRRADFARSNGNGDTANGARPLRLALDRLRITDQLSVTNMRGNFDLRRGLNGDFTGLLNDTAPISGVAIPQRGRVAVQIKSQNAGQVAAASGILRQARGGDLTLTLLPVGQSSYDGTLRVTNTRVQDAPAIAALLNSLSIVGLIDEMAGVGIQFSEVEAEFQLSPSLLTVHKASAVGPSMGLSMDGRYSPSQEVMDMRGVISPVYLLNGVGSLLTRKGEGLLGFNYRLSGPTDELRVQVNPLSALAPGFFRDLFRPPRQDAPPPE